MEAHPFGSHIRYPRTVPALDSHSFMPFPLCVPRCSLSRRVSRISFPGAQRIVPPLTLAHAKCLQRVGLHILQRWRLCNSNWCVLQPFLSRELRQVYLTRNDTPLVTGRSTITTPTATSLVINALIIFSTIHAQDFRDELGDRLMGRRTIPMVWPEGSRVWIFVIVTAWSVGLSWAYQLAPHFSVPFCALAVFVGLCFLRKRTADADRRSYRYYNVRIF
jgi:hypothetical protein